MNLVKFLAGGVRVRGLKTTRPHPSPLPRRGEGVVFGDLIYPMVLRMNRDFE